MARKYNLNYMEVSAKNNTRIDEIFYSLCKEIKVRMETENKNDLEELSRTITINASYETKRNAKGDLSEGLRLKNERCSC